MSTTTDSVQTTVRNTKGIGARRVRVRIAIVLGIAGVLVWIAYLKVAALQQSSFSVSSRARLFQIGCALSSYQEHYGQLPPAFVTGPDGRRWHSWRVIVQKHIYPSEVSGYRLSEPWDSPHNLAFARTGSHIVGNRQVWMLYPPKVVGDPSSTNLFAVYGKDTAIREKESMNVKPCGDPLFIGPVMIIESPSRSVLWTEPFDINVDSVDAPELMWGAKSGQVPAYGSVWGITTDCRYVDLLSISESDRFATARSAPEPCRRANLTNRR